MEKATKQQIMAKHGRKEGDTGSAEVQIALLSSRISEITGHMQAHKKDNSTRRGLMTMVSKRKKLLKYLSEENHAKFVELSNELGLRGQK